MTGAKLSDWAKTFEMRPGITGLAQIKVRNSVGWEDRITLDVDYIENYKLLLDLNILFKTVRIVAKEDI